VAKVQGREKLDSEVVERALQRAICFRKCKAAKGLAFRTRALVAESLMQMHRATGGKEHEAVRDKCTRAVKESHLRHEKRSEMLEKVQQGAKRILRAGHSMERSRSTSPAGMSVESQCLLRGATSSEESAMDHAGYLMGGDGGIRGYAHLDDFSDSDGPGSPTDYEHQMKHPETGTIGAKSEPGIKPNSVGFLYRQLVVEPEEDDERAAKFGLYEAFLAEVESIREILFKFHQERRPLLSQQLQTEMDDQIVKLDARQNMCIESDTQEWFVYHMMSQAERNNNYMAKKLDAWEAQLKTMTQADQLNCPVCLERFHPRDRPQETLGCCHKVCNVCWSQWQNYMHSIGKKAFCPCCHYEAFMGAVSKPDKPSTSRSPSPGLRPISPQSRGRSPQPPGRERYTESSGPPASGVTAEGRAPPPPVMLGKLSL
jgi:hypothetical protein